MPLHLVNRKLMCGIHESCTHDTTHHAEATYLILSHKWLLSFSEWKIRTDGRTDRRLNLMPPMPYPWGHNNDNNYCTCSRVGNSSLTVCLWLVISGQYWLIFHKFWLIIFQYYVKFNFRAGNISRRIPTLICSIRNWYQKHRKWRYWQQSNCSQKTPTVQNFKRLLRPDKLTVLFRLSVIIFLCQAFGLAL